MRTSIINAALTLTGNNPVQQENEGTIEWLVVSSHYNQIVSAELERHHYSFARKSLKLDSRVDGDFGFNGGFQLPEDALMVKSVWVKDDARCIPCPLQDWEQAGDILYVRSGFIHGCSCCDGRSGPQLMAEYTYCADDKVWGANFRRGIVYRLAAVIARSLNEESGEAQVLDQEAEKYLGIARIRSVRSDNSQKSRPRTLGRLHRAQYGGWSGNRNVQN